MAARGIDPDVDFNDPAIKSFLEALKPNEGIRQSSTPWPNLKAKPDLSKPKK